MGFITKQDKDVENSGSIQRYQEKNGNRKITRVDFLSAIWLESDLCDIAATIKTIERRQTVFLLLTLNK